VSGVLLAVARSRAFTAFFDSRGSVDRYQTVACVSPATEGVRSPFQESAATSRAGCPRSFPRTGIFLDRPKAFQRSQKARCFPRPHAAWRHGRESLLLATGRARVKTGETESLREKPKGRWKQF
jgi:hypothetical protein